jgi:hypothetical protein
MNNVLLVRSQDPFYGLSVVWSEVQVGQRGPK